MRNIMLYLGIIKKLHQLKIWHYIENCSGLKELNAMGATLLACQIVAISKLHLFCLLPMCTHQQRSRSEPRNVIRRDFIVLLGCQDNVV